jgi:delta-1-pyrroline-5-carboxylate synthetase
MAPSNQNKATTPRELASAARIAARQLNAVSTSKRTSILYAIADEIESNTSAILDANREDIDASKGKISDALLQRLILKPQKLAQLAAGIRAIAEQDEPIGKLLSRTELADGLVLDKVTSPIGVLLIIFEARPDALPQIAALAIRSGNGLLLKGGKEAVRSNAVLHGIIVDCVKREAGIEGLIGLVESRDDIDKLLGLHDTIDLVIPRGSNALVSYIQENTKIPVLGHADGICHVYVHGSGELGMVEKICVDSKVDYPAACNAVEKILVDEAWMRGGEGRVDKLIAALQGAGVTVHGGPRAVKEIPSLPPASSVRIEYSSLDVTLEIVKDMEEAIDHIHANGSGHTECIIAEDGNAGEDFLRKVDSACVLWNASTRFSDGYRFGLGAEVGISTSRIHARGPVGVEGLMTTRYLLRGHGQVVQKDAGVTYTHKKISTGGGALGRMFGGCFGTA